MYTITINRTLTFDIAHSYKLGQSCILLILLRTATELDWTPKNLAFQAPSCQAGMTFGISFISFDPADSAQYVAEAAPVIIVGPPSSQDR